MQVSINIVTPSTEAVLQPRESTRFAGTVTVTTSPTNALIPKIKEMGWRIENLETGEFWNPPSGEFRSDSRFWECGSRSDPETGMPFRVWGTSLPGLTGQGEWQTAVPNSIQLDLSKFPDGLFRMEVKVKVKMWFKTKAARDFARFSIDSEAPFIAIETPEAGGLVEVPAATLRGTVDDPGGHLLGVKLAVQDKDTGAWWDPAGRWRAAVRYWNADVDNDRWYFNFLGGPFGSGYYLLKVFAWDDAANISQQTVHFYSDFGSPSIEVIEPSDGVHDTRSMIEFRGSVLSRNHGWVRVLVKVEDLDTGLWWDSDYNVWGQGSRLEAFVQNNMRWRSMWRFNFDAFAAVLAGGSGRYRAGFTPVNPGIFESPNGDTVTLNFFGISVEDDTIIPDTTIVLPADESTHPQGQITFEGEASDNFSVVEVRIVLRNEADEYWDDSGQAFTTIGADAQALLDANGYWVWTWNATGHAGVFRLGALAYDAAGNYDSYGPSITFTVI